MTRITRYIAWEITIPSVLAFSVFVFLGVANEIRERMGLLDMAHIEAMDFGRMAVWFLPTLIYYIIPLTYLMGIMLAFGALTQNNEIAAMKAAGIPLKRLVAPVIMGGALLSAGCFVLQDQVQPWAMRQLTYFIYTELPQRITMDAVPPGVMHEIGDWRVYIGDKDPETNTLYDVDILELQEDGGVWLYHGESARFFKEDNRLKLHIPRGYLIMPEQGGRATIRDWTPSAPAPDTEPTPDNRDMQSLEQLLHRDAELVTSILEGGGLDSMESLLGRPDDIPAGVSVHELQELYGLRDDIRKRISLPLACLAVSLIAAPLAVRGGRSGRSFSFALGFGIFLLYYTLFMVMQARGIPTLTETVVRGIMPNAVLAVMGIVAIWRVDRV